MITSYIPSRLIDWQKKAGRHNLPWQNTGDAYLVWISEVMLQQTQVKTVIPYFNKFIKTFPNINVLAEAHEDTVMQYWSGLGYYRRAKYLMQSAKIVVKQHHSILPNTVDELVTLPGIGRSTAGAICALAYERPEPILDANVKRVFCRFYAIKDWAGESKTEAKLWDIAKKNLPLQEISTYTQALMDLGATLCKIKQPSCLQCPLEKKCKSYKKNLVGMIPVKKISKAIPTRDSHLLILESKDHILLEKRIQPGVWEGLWSLPEVNKDCYANERVEDLLGESSFKKLREGLSLAIFSHYKMRLHFKHIYLKELTNEKIEKKFRWFDKSLIIHAALPAPVKKLLKNI